MDRPYFYISLLISSSFLNYDLLRINYVTWMLSNAVKLTGTICLSSVIVRLDLLITAIPGVWVTDVRDNL